MSSSKKLTENDRAFLYNNIGLPSNGQSLQICDPDPFCLSADYWFDSDEEYEDFLETASTEAVAEQDARASVIGRSSAFDYVYYTSYALLSELVFRRLFRTDMYDIAARALSDFQTRCDVISAPLVLNSLGYAHLLLEASWKTVSNPSSSVTPDSLYETIRYNTSEMNPFKPWVGARALLDCSILCTLSRLPDDQLCAPDFGPVLKDNPHLVSRWSVAAPLAAYLRVVTEYSLRGHTDLPIGTGDHSGNFWSLRHPASVSTLILSASGFRK